MKLLLFLTGLFTSAHLLQAVAPVINYQPTDQSSDSGRIVQFYSYASTNDGVPHYQWYHDTTLLQGQSGFSPASYLYLTNVMPTDAGGYRVVFTNSFGASTSQVAHLVVFSRGPVVTTDPQGAQVCPNTPVTLYVSAEGSFPLHYQWRLNNTNISGAAGFFDDCFCVPTTGWAISGVESSTAGNYTVVVTNAFGSRTSAVASVVFPTSPPTIVSGPATNIVLAGSGVGFYVTLGFSCYETHLQWQHNGVGLPPNDSPSLFLYPVKTNDAGTYSVIASNYFGSTTGIVAYLTVTEQAPKILQDPLNQTVYAGYTAVFSVTV